MKDICRQFFCRLLLSCHFLPHSGFSGLDLVVTQSPHLTVTEGGTVQIKCCWNQNLIRATVNWKSNATNMSVLVNNRQCQNRSSKHNESCCLNLTISNLNRSDSGTYTCKVSSEIPVLQQSVGNGTHLTVISARQHGSQEDIETSEDIAVRYTWRCLPILVILSVIFYYKCKKKRKSGQGL